MRMQMLMRLVTPDPTKGDTPFESRPYGRLRLTEPMARRLQDMVKEEIDFLRNERRVLKERGKPDDLIELPGVEEDLKITRKIGENLLGVLREKGWW